MASFLHRTTLVATAALLLSAPALAQEPTGSGGSQEGSWFPAEKKEAPGTPVDDEPEEVEAKPEPKPAPAPKPSRPEAAPPPVNRPAPAVYAPDGPATSGHARRKLPAGNVGIYLGGSGAGGHLTQAYGLRSQVDGAAVFGVDLQFNVSPNFTLGGYLDLGAVERRGDCPVGQHECEDGILRLGVSARYHARPGRGVDPWFGVGTGFTSLWFTNRQEGDYLRRNLTYVGFDLLNLQAGVDFSLGRVFSLGPYIAFNNGVYTGVSEETSGGPYGETRNTDRLSSPTLHTWTTLGIRGKFNFF